MTLDTQLRTRLTTAVDDTTVPPGLAGAALTGGRRRRRRRRTAAGIALATATVVGGAMLLPGGGPVATDTEVAGGDTATSTVALDWARSLPEGAAPALPFFGEGGLWDSGTRTVVPDSVDRTVPPREVAGGWLVMVGEGEGDSVWAVLAADGTLRHLPAEASAAHPAETWTAAVSADGDQLATGDWLVDLTTMHATALPNVPATAESDGFAAEIRVVGFTEQGLVYEGAPFDQGFGTYWLVRPDGSTAQVDPPEGSHISHDGPADVAMSYDYAADDSDTCATSYVLRGEAWVQDGQGCMGHSLGEALTVSPDHQWLVTDDLPELWNLQDGAWHTLEMPEDIGRVQMDAQMGGVVWETADTFLLPVADQWSGLSFPQAEFDQQVQVVRCTMSSGACERAGVEQQVEVTSTLWGATEVAFAS